jgi:hypothetical protein
MKFKVGDCLRTDEWECDIVGIADGGTSYKVVWNRLKGPAKSYAEVCADVVLEVWANKEGALVSSKRPKFKRNLPDWF